MLGDRPQLLLRLVEGPTRAAAWPSLLQAVVQLSGWPLLLLMSCALGAASPPLLKGEEESQGGKRSAVPALPSSGGACP
jgi:hypothetical protein